MRWTAADPTRRRFIEEYDSSELHLSTWHCSFCYSALLGKKQIECQPDVAKLVWRKNGHGLDIHRMRSIWSWLRPFLTVSYPQIPKNSSTRSQQQLQSWQKMFVDTFSVTDKNEVILKGNFLRWFLMTGCEWESEVAKHSASWEDCRFDWFWHSQVLLGGQPALLHTCTTRSVSNEF